MYEGIYLREHKHVWVVRGKKQTKTNNKQQKIRYYTKTRKKSLEIAVCYRLKTDSRHPLDLGTGTYSLNLIYKFPIRLSILFMFRTFSLLTIIILTICLLT